MKTQHSLLMIGAGLFLSGCATVPVQEAFVEVQDRAHEQHGQELEWQGVTTTEPAVAETVAALIADGVTQDEAVRIAVLNNARLQAVYESFGVARADLVAAGLLENPVFSGNVLFETSSVQAWELEIVEALLSVLTIPLRRAIAEDALEQARLAILSESLDVAMDTRRAFLHYLADEQAFALQTDYLSAEEAAWEMTLKLREAGNIPLTQLAAAQMRLEEARLSYSAAELDIEGSRERVTRLMGLWGTSTSWEALGVLPETVEAQPLPSEYERAAVENSLDLASAWLDVKLAARRAGIHNVEAVFPELEIGAKFESPEPESGDRHWEVGPAWAVSVPIFNQGQAERAAGRAQVRREWNFYTATAVELRSAARSAAHHVNVTREMAVYENQVTVPLARHAVDQALLEYNAMLIGPVELLRVKQDEIQAERAYVQSLLEFWLARADLDQILMGRLVIRAPEHRPDIIGANVQRASRDSEGGH